MSNLKHIIKEMIIQQINEEGVEIFKPYKKLYGAMFKNYRDSWTNRLTGETVPASINWNKTGGHAGAKTITTTVDKALSMGFEKIDGKSAAIPDGSSVTGSEYFRDSKGFTLVVTSTYGSTASRNYFSMALFAPKEK